MQLTSSRSLYCDLRGGCGIPQALLRRWRFAPAPRQQGVTPTRGLASQAAAAAATASKALSWQQLHRAAQVAAWSGLCYRLPEQLERGLAAQHPELTLVAHGRNEFTSWYIADGSVPASKFCSSVRQRSSSSSSSSSANGSAAVGGDGGDDVCEVPAGVRERYVFFRGVQWAAPDADTRKMSQALMRMWPAPFPRAPLPGAAAAASSSSDSSPGGSAASSSSLVAHEGVADIASSLFERLRPYLDQADDVGMPLCFAGHSLGGSLAMLNMLLHRLHSRRSGGAPTPSCYTFGSPPVLAHEQGGGGHRVLEAAGLPPGGCVHNFVLENDPVPRALLSVDPTFELLKRWSGFQGLLQLRGLLSPGGPVSPDRFLFECVGDVHLIKWTPEGGSQVVPLDAHEMERELSLLPQQPQPAAAAAAADTAAAGGFAAAVSSLLTPVRGLQAWLDHHHGSYAQEIEAAALRSVRHRLQPSRSGSSNGSSAASA